MKRCGFLAVLAAAALTGVAGAADDVAGWLEAVRGVGPEGAGSPAARAAWERLAGQGPEVLPRVLEAMDTPDVVAANWLRTAFDRIAGRARKQDGKGIDVDAVLAFAKDAKRQGRARRLALELVEELRPGTRDRLLAGWLEDPEFGQDAIDGVLKLVDDTKDLPRDQREKLLRQAFAASRDVQQVRAVASQLRALDIPVSMADHLGLLRSWHVIGPFDGKEGKGFATAYPPEEKVDLGAELAGKDGKKLRWTRFEAEEARAGRHVVLVSLCQPLGDADDAVGYAWTAFEVKEPREVEMRGAADDNLTVWVNGKRVFAFEEYRNGVRHDRHRFRASLRAGVNTVLVKVVQAPVDPSNPAPNWEFFLRICEPGGKGLVFPPALAGKSK